MYLSSALLGGLLVAGSVTASPARGVSNKNIKRGEDGACHEDNVHWCFIQSVDAASAFCTGVLQTTDAITVTPTVTSSLAATPSHKTCSKKPKATGKAKGKESKGKGRDHHGKGKENHGKEHGRFKRHDSCLDALSISPAEATSACSCIGITTVTASCHFIQRPSPLLSPLGLRFLPSTLLRWIPRRRPISPPLTETITSAATDCPAATTIVSTITRVEVQTTIHIASQDVATVTETQTATLPPVAETVTETATAETLVSTITELHTETQTQTLTETETLIQTQTEVETQTQTLVETQIQTQTLVETQIQTQTATLIQTQVETETHTQIQLETSIQVSSFTTTVTTTASASVSACPTVAAAASPIKNGNLEGNSLRGWNNLATTGSGGTSSVGTTTNHITPQGRYFLHLYTGYNVHPVGRPT
ncbi:uncharacterized protein QC763_700460 [Podospora pseudopauciseta]|uniref:Uncharacterized protein n=1 Tax=Podospora pseudopauciseta TaxID=2093780 RepID=A0ABR0H2T1_9PEZI|nr:hypothetical protein QC763_700460 [Podospora pseudopauciseta]